MLNRQHHTHSQFESPHSQPECERCGKPATTVVASLDGLEEVTLCDECVKIVVRPGSLYRVKSDDDEPPFTRTNPYNGNPFLPI